ncbi:hypothetical protein PBY51_016822 [Eleginops maclovinus]|uniref:Uncharacterized protein n=1 Tax=Eleginops maclovinus TaxID=56733 RepID=A0AAN7WUQ1_ELEMC|nr:hypothetical protein PBY51_016822 [Eleginops maclovinus]
MCSVRRGRHAAAKGCVCRPKTATQIWDTAPPHPPYLRPEALLINPPSSQALPPPIRQVEQEAAPEH